MDKKKRAKQQTTYTPTQQQASHSWLIIDAAGKTLGRLSSEIAKILRGKHKVDFTPHVDSGDGVIVVNAEKVRVTGNKAAQKVYHRYTGWIGGLREVPFETMLARNPGEVISHAVRGMLPKTKLGRRQAKRLRVQAGAALRHTAQKPINVNI